MVNTLSLKALIIKKGLKHSELAKKINISSVSLSKKINNIVEFKASEIQNISNILDITDIDEIFFI